MIRSRRGFLTAAAALATAWGAKLLAAQRQIPGPAPIPNSMPRVPTVGNPFPDDPLGNMPPPEHRIGPNQQLKMNQAEIRKDMEKLKAAVSDLEKEFDTNDTTTVLSIGALRKTDEIEKLAHHIHSLVRG